MCENKKWKAYNLSSHEWFYLHYHCVDIHAFQFLIIVHACTRKSRATTWRKSFALVSCQVLKNTVRHQIYQYGSNKSYKDCQTSKHSDYYLKCTTNRPNYDSFLVYASVFLMFVRPFVLLIRIRIKILDKVVFDKVQHRNLFHIFLMMRSFIVVYDPNFKFHLIWKYDRVRKSTFSS